MSSWAAGIAVRGDGRGRQLGFPTANLVLDDPAKRPIDGVYACRVKIGADAAIYQGALHAGPRPTFAGSEVTVEVHILDFPDRDLYGQRISFLPVERLRDIKKFASIEELIAALHADCANARSRLG